MTAPRIFSGMPCSVCQGTHRYVRSKKCIACAAALKGEVLKFNFAKKARPEKTDDEIRQLLQPETVIYNPRRRFHFEQLKTPHFKIAEKVVMAGVNYE